MDLARDLWVWAWAWTVWGVQTGWEWAWAQPAFTDAVSALVIGAFVVLMLNKEMRG